jgi:hypothetical protein
MADDAMSTGMAGLGLAGDGGAPEPDVSDTPVMVPPVNMQTAAYPTADDVAAGSMGVGESIPAPFSPLSCRFSNRPDHRPAGSISCFGLLGSQLGCSEH